MDDDEHMKHVITLQLLESLPKLTGLRISPFDDGNVFSVLCRPCNKCISKSNRAKLSNLQEHLNGKYHRTQVTNTLTYFETWIVQKEWEKVSLDANGFLMLERENSVRTIDKPPVESITEPKKEVSLRNTSSVVSVNLSEIFSANTITPLKIGYLCNACATIFNPTPTWEIIVSHLKSTRHTEKLLKWNSTHMQAKLLDIPSHLTPVFAQNFLQHKEKEIYCISCSAHLHTVESLINHTNSKNHTKKLNLFMQTISMATILNLEENCTSKHFQPSLSAAANWASSPKSVETRKSTDLKTKLMQTSDELVSLKRKHHIVGEKLHCKSCNVHLKTLPNILSHIKGSQHRSQLSKFKFKLRQKFAKSTKKSSKPSTKNSISDQSNLMMIPNELTPLISQHMLQHLEKEIYCTACSAHLQTVEILINHINSKNHMAKLNLLLQSSEYNNIDINPSIKLMDTEQDQKCFQQERFLFDTPTGSVSNDIHATVPISTSPAFTTAMNTSITSVLISTSSAASSTPSLCNSSINDSISDQPNLMKIPDELKPLISKHLLQHLETEIYCDTCSAHLQSAQRLVEHTESKLHKLNLNHRIKDEKLKSKLNMIEEKSRQPKCLTSNHSLPDKNTPLKATNLSKNRPKADSNYLSIDINEIYKVDPEKLRIIEMSCQLCFPKSPQSLYCLICEKSTPKNVQNFYEHMFSDSHSQYFADLEANDLLYADYPNQFSSLKLLKEFIMELTDETFQCLICDALVLNLDAEILVHIKQEKHIIQKRRLNKLSKEKFLKTVLHSTRSYHDNIKFYWCELCDFSSDSAFAFAKHSSDPTDNTCLEQRSSHECNPIYDSCIPCASLWLGFMNTYARHCQKKGHKDNVLEYQIIKEITLPREAIIYLKHAEQKGEDLIQLSDQVVTKEQCKVDNLLKCLKTTIKPVFPKAKAYPFGSRMSGLGFPESDIDIFLDCSTYFRTPISEKDQQRIIDAVTLCLHGNKKLWKIEDVLTSGRIPIIKLYHQSTELSCDISFKNGLSVGNTKLLKCFVNNCPMVRRLILFLKKWLAICKLSGSRYITNYALCWYVVFYLQSKTILPSVADLIRQGNKSKMVAGWETGISDKFVPRMPDETFLSLLQGFFKYYAMFNFRKCVACPLLGYTVSKDDFADLSSLPPEMAPYINHLRVTIDHTQMFRIDSPMCIQDPYDLAHNLTKAVSKLDLAIFKQFCEASAEVLNSDFKMP